MPSLGLKMTYLESYSATKGKSEAVTPATMWVNPTTLCQVKEASYKSHISYDSICAKFQNRQDRDSRLIRSCPGSQWGMGWGYMTGDRVSFGGDENVQNLIVMTAAQPREYTEYLLNIY